MKCIEYCNWENSDNFLFYKFIYEVNKKCVLKLLVRLNCF